MAEGLKSTAALQRLPDVGHGTELDSRETLLMLFRARIPKEGLEMKAWRVLWIGSVVLLVCGCSSSTPTPSGDQFAVFAPSPDVAEDLSIEQGGEQAFEVGSAVLHYEIRMNEGFSGAVMTMGVSGLPAGVFLPDSDEIALSEPFSLKSGAVRNGLFTLWADNTAVPGVYTVTVTVTGTFSPDSTTNSISDTFTLTVTERV